jgi:group I intron endonuclease
MIIYKVTNLSNGKVYIGKTTLTLNTRKARHYASANRGSETNFHRALRVYSTECFKWEISSKANDENQLNELEILYIKEYNSYKEGYNMTEGGDGGVTIKKGTELYERVKHKFSNWKNGNPGATPEAIKKRVETFKTVKWVSGKSHSNYGHSHNKGCLLGEKNPMYGKVPTNARRIQVDDKVYDSVTAAARGENVSTNTIYNRIKKLDTYYYLD